MQPAKFAILLHDIFSPKITGSCKGRKSSYLCMTPPIPFLRGQVPRPFPTNQKAAGFDRQLSLRERAPALCRACTGRGLAPKGHEQLCCEGSGDRKNWAGKI